MTDWRQGDCALERQIIFHLRANPAIELADKPEGHDTDQLVGQEPCEGFVVLTQSCDIVRRVEDYPFVEVAPLVKVDGERLAEIKALRRPRYVFVPGAEAHGVVADLGRIMSVKKEVVAAMSRIVGCRDDQEKRRFSAAVAQKYSRIAFPDDFVEIVSPLRKMLTKRHGKNSAEGQAVSALHQVRVRAAPSWNASKIDVHFWFLWDDSDESNAEIDWDKWCDEWLKLIRQSEKYNVSGLPAGLEDVTARDYIESDALDLDRLSAEPGD